MSAMIPYGCHVGGFILAVDMREVAAHYGLTRWRLLRHSDGRAHETVAQARDALFWRLIAQRKLSPQRAGDLLGASAKTAREAAARHRHRMAQFFATFRPAEESADAEA